MGMIYEEMCLCVVAISRKNNSINSILLLPLLCRANLSLTSFRETHAGGWRGPDAHTGLEAIFTRTMCPPKKMSIGHSSMMSKDVRDVNGNPGDLHPIFTLNICLLWFCIVLKLDVNPQGSHLHYWQP